MRAVWYRHWLEIRGGLLVASGLILLTSLVVYPLFVWLAPAAAGADGGGGPFRPIMSVLPAVGADRFVAWGAHAWLSAFSAWLVVIFLGGTGVRSNSFEPGHPSLTYTLTLPVARSTLIWTRLAASGGAALALFLAMLGVEVLILLMTGRGVPLAAMAMTSGLAVCVALVLIAVLGLVMMVDERLVGWVIAAAFVLVMEFLWPPTLRYVGSQHVPWVALAAMAASLVATLSLTAALARRRDF